MFRINVKHILLYLSLGFLSFCLFYSCTSSRTQARGSEYKFRYEEEFFHIRSYFSPQESENINTLIGKDLLAIDFDQDGIIDKVDRGNIKIDEVQRIYDHGLLQGNKEKKLQIRVPLANTYVNSTDGFSYEIKTIKPFDSQVFNEFKISDNRPLISQATIFIDKNADGSLDDLIKGKYDFEEAQKIYSRILDEGMQLGGIKKHNGMYLIKEND